MDLIAAALRTLFGTSAELPGLAPGLIVRNPAGWHSAADLDGPLLDELLRAAERHWDARRPAAAALAWKAYSYWVSLPAVVGLLAVRRVPVLTRENVLVRIGRSHPLLTIGLRAGTPVAGADQGELRRSLLDEHLAPLAEAFARRSRLQRRILLGSVAAGVAGPALRFAPREEVGSLLEGLDLRGLVDLVTDDRGRTRVRRRTCCLAFTLPQPRLCGDCMIRVLPRRRPRQQ